MYNRVTLRNRIQLDLNDIVGVYFDVDMVNNSIQDAYDEVVTQTQCIEQDVTVDFINSQVYYDMYNSGPPGYWRMSKTFNQNTNRWMDCADTRYFDKYRFDWEASNGTPWFSEIVGYQYLGFFPHYVSGAGLQFQMLCKIGKDTLLTDSQVLQIPTSFIKCITNWVTGDLLESIFEFTKADDYFADYEVELNKFKVQVTSRMLPNLYMQLNDLDFPQNTLP